MSEKFSVSDSLSFESLGDRVLIKEDDFRSGYECERCLGKGEFTCPECNGLGFSGIVNGAHCKECSGRCKVSCPECGGKGGLLAVPETMQRRPTTGTIVSAGEDVKQLKVGESVLYSNFAGYVVDLERSGVKVVLRILHESEVFCRIQGHLELRNLKQGDLNLTVA